MKKLLTLAAGLGLVFTVAGTASAVSNPSNYAAGAIAGGIVNSRHNLGSTGIHFRADNTVHTNGGGGGYQVASSGGTSEVCIFCHTPHHGSSNGPLWNKGSNAGSYTTYGTTVAGTRVEDNLNGGVLGSATLACLSCHDGVNTFDTIVNWPGKDGMGTNANGGTSTNMAWVFTEDGGVQSDFMTSGRLNLGTDLRNDHPVSVQYFGGTRASLRATSTVISTITMDNDTLTVGDSTASRTHTANLWSVSGYLNDTATISDILRLGQVECSSCHDPHFKNQSWDEVSATWHTSTYDQALGTSDMDGLFLRRVGGNSLSGVCRTCHGK